MLKQLISKRSLLLVVSLIITMQSVTAYAANELAVIRTMTEKYHQLEVALDEGFQPVFDCISHQSAGAMGYHYGLFSRFDDQLVLEEPEVLVYAQIGRAHV